MENAIVYTARNPLTRKHEEIDIETAELPPGTAVLKWFATYAVNGSHMFVTIPGASLFYANGYGGLIAEAE